MPHVTMRDGARLHYLSVGRGRQTMILLHGFAMRAELWLPFVLPLAHRVRFILPNLRGFGGSHRLALRSPDLLASHADDLHDLIDGLHLDGAMLAGLSMGACTSMAYQQRHGFGRISRYLHIDQSPRIDSSEDWPWGLFGHEHHERLGGWNAVLPEFERYDRRTPFERLPQHLRRALWHNLSDFLGAAMNQPLLNRSTRLVRHPAFGRQFMAADNWAVHLDCIRAYRDRGYDFRESLRTIEVPMTVFVGMQSRMYPAEGQLAIRDYVPHAKLVRFERSGHAIPFDSPASFVRELGRFAAAA